VSIDGAAERLEQLEALLADLVEENEQVPVLVEGERDVAALRALGLEGEILRVKTSSTVWVVCEIVARAHRKVVVLVDWDRSGGTLARMLEDGLTANGARADMAFRRAIAIATRKEIMQVEDLPGYLESLRWAARKHADRRPTFK
jgi:5S rRNA maturation endonuclease (ribonuclease M5)